MTSSTLLPPFSSLPLPFFIWQSRFLFFHIGQLPFLVPSLVDIYWTEWKDENISMGLETKDKVMDNVMEAVENYQNVERKVRETAKSQAAESLSSRSTPPAIINEYKITRRINQNISPSMIVVVIDILNYPIVHSPRFQIENYHRILNTNQIGINDDNDNNNSNPISPSLSPSPFSSSLPPSPIVCTFSIEWSDLPPTHPFSHLSPFFASFYIHPYYRNTFGMLSIMFTVLKEMLVRNEILHLFFIQEGMGNEHEMEMDLGMDGDGGKANGNKNKSKNNISDVSRDRHDDSDGLDRLRNLDIDIHSHSAENIGTLKNARQSQSLSSSSSSLFPPSPSTSNSTSSSSSSSSSPSHRKFAYLWTHDKQKHYSHYGMKTFAKSQLNGQDIYLMKWEDESDPKLRGNAWYGNGKMKVLDDIDDNGEEEEMENERERRNAMKSKL